jgi:hypothetical protein
MGIFSLFSKGNSETQTEQLSVTIKDKNSDKKNNDIIPLVDIKLKESKYFTDEGITFVEELLSQKKLSESSISEIMKPFHAEPIIPLEMRKEYNINTRQKTNIDLFYKLTEDGKHCNCITDFLENIILSSVSKITNKYTLLQYKKEGIKKVEIICAGDDRDCPAVKKIKKPFKIDEVPELPLPECTAELCRCCYAPIVEF